jgi:signal transduction histidine kinase
VKRIRRQFKQLAWLAGRGLKNWATAPPDETADRANLLRIQIIGLIGLLDCVAEATFSYFLHDGALVWLWSIAFFCLVGFIVLARAASAGRTSRTVVRLLPTIYISFLLVTSETAGYFIALTHRLPYGYAMLILALSAIFMVTPARFAAIAGVTFVIYVVQISFTPHAPLELIVIAFNTGLAAFGAVVIRTFLYHLRQRERRQLSIIAEQNAALQRANSILAAHNDELNELMAVAAHDLRSPLFGLRNLLDLALSRETASSELYRSVLGEGSRSITIMLALVGRLLKAHEVENPAQIIVQSEDLRHAVVAAARDNAVIAQSARIPIETRLPSDPVWALMEQDAVAQVLGNLLSNAVRFSPAGAVIVVECGYEGNHAVISVSDSGAGVPPDEQQDIFGKFRRGSSEPLRGGRGSGLGLYISSKLTTAMGGELRYKARANDGSVFSMALVAASLSLRDEQDASGEILA